MDKVIVVFLVHLISTALCVTLIEYALDTGNKCYQSQEASNQSRCYTFTTNLGEWQAGRNECLTINGTFQPIKTQVEQDTVAAAMQSAGLVTVWLPGFEIDGNWTWISTDLELNESRWGPKEPKESPARQCALAIPSDNWRWYAFACSLSNPESGYICEKDLVTNTECSTETFFNLHFNSTSKCFYLSDESLTFHKAREKCMQFNMTLISVDTQEVYDKMMELNTLQYSFQTFYWIGLTKSRWFWEISPSTREEILSAFWYESRPQYLGPETCLQVQQFSDGSYKWNNTDSCNINATFLCEINTPPTPSSSISPSPSQTDSVTSSESASSISLTSSSQDLSVSTTTPSSDTVSITSTATESSTATSSGMTSAVDSSSMSSSVSSSQGNGVSSPSPSDATSTNTFGVTTTTATDVSTSSDAVPVISTTTTSSIDVTPTGTTSSIQDNPTSTDSMPVNQETSSSTKTQSPSTSVISSTQDAGKQTSVQTTSEPSSSEPLSTSTSLSQQDTGSASHSVTSTPVASEQTTSTQDATSRETSTLSAVSSSLESDSSTVLSTSVDRASTTASIMSTTSSNNVQQTSSSSNSASAAESSGSSTPAVGVATSTATSSASSETIQAMTTQSHSTFTDFQTIQPSSTMGVSQLVSTQETQALTSPAINIGGSPSESVMSSSQMFVVTSSTQGTIPASQAPAAEISNFEELSRPLTGLAIAVVVVAAIIVVGTAIGAIIVKRRKARTTTAYPEENMLRKRYGSRKASRKHDQKSQASTADLRSNEEGQRSPSDWGSVTSSQRAATRVRYQPNQYGPVGGMTSAAQFPQTMHYNSWLIRTNALK